MGFSIFIKDKVDFREVSIELCPTGMMWADVLTRPIQGQAFNGMRAALMNHKIDNSKNNCDNSRLMEGKSPTSMKGDITSSPQECAGRGNKTVRWGQKEFRLMLSQERDRPQYDIG